VLDRVPNGEIFQVLETIEIGEEEGVLFIFSRVGVERRSRVARIDGRTEDFERL
jgi:hypothetical protein